MTTDSQTRYIFSTKEPQDKWVFQAPQDLGFDDPTSSFAAMEYFEALREDWTHIRVERLHAGTYTDVSNDIEQAIWDRDEEDRRDLALDYAHERSERMALEVV